jgi:isoquinoline 1-oxidoreductase alpha subunit
MIELNVNGKVRDYDVDPSMPLLWFLRDVANLTGTKYGCGIALCGACTVHLDGQAVRSCVTPVAAAVGRKVTTVEGVVDDGIGRAVQAAWQKLDVVQCGYCQSGQIMQAASLLAKNTDPTKAELVAHMDGNLCRCMSYVRIQRAILRAAAEMRGV